MTGCPPQYTASRLRQALAEDDRTAELGIGVTVRGDEVFLSGDVATPERRDRIAEVAAEVAPGCRIHNGVRVFAVGEPVGREEIG